MTDGKVTAWEVKALVDWPPGSARRWPQGGKLARAEGNVTPAVATVSVVLPTGGRPASEVAQEEVLRHLKDAGHRWVQWVSCIRDRLTEAKALGLVEDTLLRAAHDSRARRA